MTVENNAQPSENPFESSTAAVSPSEMRALIATLKLDASDDKLKSLLESVEKGDKTIDSESFQKITTLMLADSEQHLNELEHIGNFNIELR